MRSDLVEEASKIIPEPPVLINLVSARVKQLNLGRSPLIQTDHRMGAADRCGGSTRTLESRRQFHGFRKHSDFPVVARYCQQRRAPCV